MTVVEKLVVAKQLNAQTESLSSSSRQRGTGPRPDLREVRFVQSYSTKSILISSSTSNFFFQVMSSIPFRVPTRLFYLHFISPMRAVQPNPLLSPQSDGCNNG
jgi:hypothetical protein